MDPIVSQTILVKATESAVTKAIPAVFNSLKNKFNNLNFKTEEEFKIVYEDYLNKNIDKYSKIKNLLYRTHPVNLYTFFEPMNLKSSGHTVTNTLDSENITNISKRLFITGTGGMGKSILMKHIFLDAASKQAFIPIFIELKDLNKVSDISFIDYVYQSIIKTKLKVTPEQFEYTLDMGRYLFLLDGLDEIDPQVFETIEFTLKSFIDQYDKNNFIISSRPSDSIIGWSEFHEYQVEKLSKAQALSLINKLEYDIEIKDKFYKQVKRNLYDKHQSFASIPLLLTIMLVTYTDGGDIPNNLVAFYEQAYIALFYQHDASKSGFTRSMKTKNILDIEQFRHVLSYIAFKTFFSSNVDISKQLLVESINKYKTSENLQFKTSDFIDDAENAVCLLIKEGTDYKFAHRSFQEYFAALYVERLNDHIQSKIFRAWIENDFRVIRANSVFVDTLLYKQQSRLVENLIFPIIERFKINVLMDSDHSLEQLYYDSIERIIVIGSDDREMLSMSLSQEFNLIFNLFLLITSEIDRKKIRDIYDSDRIKKELILEKKLIELYNVENSIEVSSFKKNHEVNDVYIEWCNSWVKPMLKYLYDWQSIYSKKSKSYKRTLDSLIDSF